MEGVRSLVIAALREVVEQPIVGADALARPPAGTAWLRVAVEPATGEGGIGWRAEGGDVVVAFFDPLINDPAPAESQQDRVAVALGGQRLASQVLALVLGAPRQKGPQVEGAFRVGTLLFSYLALQTGDKG